MTKRADKNLCSHQACFPHGGGGGGGVGVTQRVDLAGKESIWATVFNEAVRESEA